MRRKKVVILGSTGSIGINTLKVIDRFPEQFEVVGLSARRNVRLLRAQIKKYSPALVAIEPAGFHELRALGLYNKVQFFDVKDVTQVVERSGADILVLAMSGAAALAPFLSAVRRGMRVAPANKEALVMAGDLIMAEAKKHHAAIIPIDSEQSAIFQCLEGRNGCSLKRIYLTASGGALYRTPQSRFNRLSVKEILQHPRWKMGKKITVDSATLMNKGFEVIEAHRLFGVPVHKIAVVIHPQAIIHSMVEFEDGSIIAQMGVTDMRLPIQYALTYPRRLASGLAPMDFVKLKTLTFDKPDYQRFPSLSLAFYAAKRGGTLPCVLNAADEEAVHAFLSGDIRFIKIYDVAERVVRKHRLINNPGLSDILGSDRWAREEAQRIIAKL